MPGYNIIMLLRIKGPDEQGTKSVCWKLIAIGSLILGATICNRVSCAASDRCFGVQMKKGN